MDEFFDRIAALLRRHPRIVLATVVSTGGSAPREAGARMAVLPDGAIVGTVGGGALEKKVIVVPGAFFDVDPGQRRHGRFSRFSHHIRFSFGPSKAVMETALERLAAVVAEAQ